ncbi:hypothetical protein OCU04_011057 [Sclerotinia nivalis]|uniref:BTB domain-containing protein n=1 Tax=Sclerotinia nivalis TaxID=352851 RepID=A0A9X0DHA5_9HELO|nr:hypothetical protein OCU04_011057 [Sclerotinia nivalis]
MSQKRNHAEFSAGLSMTEEKTLVGTKSHVVARGNNNSVAKRKTTMFMDSLGTEMASIHVGSGEDQKCFHAYKRTICAKSSYFKEIFKNGGSIANLPDHSPQLFDVLLEWMYTDKLRSIDEILLDCNDTTLLYQMAENLGLPKAMNSIMDQFQAYDWENDLTYLVPAIKSIYKVTSKGSRLRIYAVRQIAFDLQNNGGSYSHEELLSLFKNDDFTLDFIEATSNKWVEDPREEVSCRFHVHIDGDTCARKDEEDEGDWDFEVDRLNKDNESAPECACKLNAK